MFDIVRHTLWTLNIFVRVQRSHVHGMLNEIVQRSRTLCGTIVRIIHVVRHVWTLNEIVRRSTCGTLWTVNKIVRRSTFLSFTLCGTVNKNVRHRRSQRSRCAAQWTKLFDVHNVRRSQRAAQWTIVRRSTSTNVQRPWMLNKNVHTWCERN